MIDRTIEFSLKNRLMISVMALLVVGMGIRSLRQLPIDAFPDVTPVLVQIFTESPGLAPEEVEQLVTYPVEVAMNGLPGIQQVRSISMFGLSAVNVYFADDVDIYFARQLVLERVQTAREDIPEGFGEPELGPITTGLGQVYQYTVEGEGLTNMELRTIQDWIVRFNVRTVPGVTEVLSFGGEVRQYQVRVDPGLLLQYGVTLGEVMDAVRANNRNVGGSYIVRNAEEYLVRGIGLAGDLEAIRDIIVETRGDGTPIYITNVAEVELGPEIRRGAVTKDGQGEVVTGIVLKLIGENTSDVIRRVKEKVAAVNEILPDGVRVVPFYDQADLVERAVETVTDALLEGGILIVIVLFLFLGNVRSSLIVAATLPLSLLLAFILMDYLGMSANLMSLGGLAIGIGMMVDGGVVMVENIYRHLSEAEHEQGTEGGSGFREARAHRVLRAALEVGRPITFAIVIIIVVFLPLFTLEGVEGKLFKPMAFTVSFAMVGSLIFSLTVIPVLSSFFLRGGSEKDTWIMRLIRGPYERALDWAMDNRGQMTGGAVLLLVGSLVLFPFLGTEFVPALEEGSVLLRVTFAPSTGLDEAATAANRMERMVLSSFGDEVETLVSKIGRAEVGGDPEPVNNVEMYMGLRPQSEWRYASKTELVEAIEQTLSGYPGVLLNFSQPIATRVDELLSGVRAQLAIKLFGDDLDILKEKADEIARVVQGIEGAADVQAEQVSGQPQLQIEVDRHVIARYGLNVDDVLELVEVAVGGEEAGQVFEGQRRFSIFVRLGEAFRDDPASISDILLTTPSGAQIPLGQLADIREIIGPKQISREANQRRIVVQANVRGRDMGGFVAEAQAAVDVQVDLPTGYIVEWGGQFENQRRAMRRLSIIIPITVALIFLLLFFSFNSLRMASLIILNVPFGLIGGIVGLWVSRQYLSVPASVGFIALFGVAVLNGVVMVSYIVDIRRREGSTAEAAARKGAQLRLRPVLMTALVASLGLTPLLFSSGAGSEVQRPLAVVVVGGLVTSTILTLVLLPSFYVLFDKDAPRPQGDLS
ncbi:MAG: CusA/CzcA family heavy metal efflux RND transporter [Gemmatimonadota bacterium]|nr:MAG: CusA/CzcA family heavy metal efflux RND transporter [Gemmatimonadota bacterium]